MRTRSLAPALACASAAIAPCAAQLRVVQWNVTSYQSGRAVEFQTALYASFAGRSVTPDVIVAQEINSSLGAANFLDILNTAPGLPADWALAPFVPNAGDSSNALFYRTSKLTYLSVITLSEGTGSGPGMPPRDNQRWRIRLAGFNSAGAELYLYSAHMKAGSAASDRDRRTPEAQRIRDDAETLPPTANFLLAGDFNMQSWNETGYQILLSPAPSLQRRFVDPIKSPGFLVPSPTGSWNSNNNYRFIHTQDPATCDAACAEDCNGGGMDDRHDQILISPALIDSVGLSYVGNPLVPYSTTTWNDPNHSYRAWGNDGSSFNCRLATTGNAMVGPAIAQALIETARGQGHLPVFLDLQVPARVDAPIAIHFGDVPQNEPALRTVTIANATSVSLWSRTGNAAGIDDLDYTLAASPGFGAPAGAFSAIAGLPGITHTIAMSTSTPGNVAGMLTITSDDPDQPTRTVILTGNVIPLPPKCACDWNNSGALNSQDLFDFLTAFFASNADYNADGVTNSQDFFDFLACFFAGC